MKKIYQSILLLFMAIGIAVSYSSCKKDGEGSKSSGTPSISYVRITDPKSADSLLVGAGQGSLIAIVGAGLGDTREIWFNDRKATLILTYVTNNSILVTVPSQVPVEISNKLKLVFSNGQTLEHDFKLEISKPQVTSMDCEYVLPGEVATIKGNYFYEPLTVTFAGGAEGKVVSVTEDAIKVEVPAAAQPGQITVKTNFGENKSDFWFKDNRNIFISSDPYTGWWNESFVVTSPGADDPVSINGNYIRVKRVIGDWVWTEAAGGPPDAMGPISKNIPDEAITKPEDYVLKFEVNTKKPYNNNGIIINAGLSDDFSQDGYKWNPPIDTKGVWQTVSIPFKDVTDSYNRRLTVSPNGYYSRILFLGAGQLDCDMSFDNFRVVPKVAKK